MAIELIILIFVLGLSLLVAEAFLPGAVMGILGAVAVVGAIVLGFQDHGAAAGVPLLVITLAVVPVAFAIAFRRLQLKSTLGAEQGFTAATTDPSLLHKEGVTLSALRPSGMARIDARVLDVITQGEMLPENCRIRVVKLEGNRIVVKSLSP